MNDEQKMVVAFHKRFGVAAPARPTVPTRDVCRSRAFLLKGEMKEILRALRRKRVDLVELSDGLADALYVIYGTAIAVGIDIQPVFAEVHRSNMTKSQPSGLIRNGRVRKLSKGPNWSPPNIQPILTGQSRRAAH